MTTPNSAAQPATNDDTTQRLLPDAAQGNAWNCWPCWPQICRCGNPKTFEEYQDGQGSGDADVGRLRKVREGPIVTRPVA